MLPPADCLSVGLVRAQSLIVHAAGCENVLYIPADSNLGYPALRHVHITEFI